MFTVPKAAKWFYVLVPVTTIAIGILVGVRTASFQHEAQRAVGTIIGNSLRQLDGGKTGYEPIVSFTDGTGLAIQCQDRHAGKYRPVYAVGEKVIVLYLAKDPRDTAAIDQGTENWRNALILILLIFGVGFISVANFAAIYARKAGRIPQGNLLLGLVSRNIERYTAKQQPDDYKDRK